MIEEILLEDAYNKFEEIELSIMWEKFSIDDLPNGDDIQILSSILKNQEEYLVKEKNLYIWYINR